MGGIPSVPTDSNRRVEVIAMGYSRTGTVSMSLALEKLLDGPAMHGGTQLFGREDAYCYLWVQIFRARAAGDRHAVMKLLAKATAGFASIADNPAILFLPELMELYPDARFVLVERDPESWFRSIGDIGKNFQLPMWSLKVLFAPLPSWRWVPYWLKGMTDTDTELFGKEWNPQRLVRWNDSVKSQVPSEKLLVMSLKEGWAPLAEFLDRPAPDEPFPRANDTQAIQELAKKVFGTAITVWGGILTGVGVAAWGGWRVWAARRL